MKENDEGDAQARVDETQSGSEGIERLGDHDAAADSGGNFAGQIVFDQRVARGVAPTEIEDGAEDENVEPVGEKGGTVIEEFGEEFGGDGKQGYSKKERASGSR